MLHLTEEQERVLNFDVSKRFHKVSSVAGSGKTRTLIALIIRLMKDCSQEQFFVTTFTRSAADEIKLRLQNYEVELEKLGTFHSLALQFIDGNTEIMCLDEYPVMFLEYLKNNDYCPKFTIVDEYQDVNDTQHAIVSEFAKRGSYVFAFGDSSQNIYDWRGSDPVYFHEFLPGHVCYTLSTNFRSTPEIVDLANHSKESEGTMTTRNDSGDSPIVAFFQNQLVEIERVVTQACNDWFKGIKDIAILCRTNRPLLIAEEHLLKRKMKYSKHGKVGKIALMTLHASKGLEWDHVYIIGCTDASFPTMEENEQADRRLWHVGVTRCKKRLVITYNGREEHPSRFIVEAHDSNPTLFKTFSTSFDNASQVTDRTKRSYVSPVSIWIKQFSGEHYQRLRKEGLLPKCDRFSIHDKLSFPNYVLHHEMEHEFGTFIEVVIKYELGCRRNERAEKCASGFFPRDETLEDKTKKEKLFQTVEEYPEEFHPVPKQFRSRVIHSYHAYTKGEADLSTLWDVMLCEKAFDNPRASPCFYKKRLVLEENTLLYVNTVKDACKQVQEVEAFDTKVINVLYHCVIPVTFRNSAIFFHVSEERLTAEILLQCLLSLSSQTITEFTVYEPCQGIFHQFAMDHTRNIHDVLMSYSTI